MLKFNHFSQKERTLAWIIGPFVVAAFFGLISYLARRGQRKRERIKQWENLCPAVLGAIELVVQTEPLSKALNDSLMPRVVALGAEYYFSWMWSWLPTPANRIDAVMDSRSMRFRIIRQLAGKSPTVIYSSRSDWSAESLGARLKQAIQECRELQGALFTP